MITDYLQNRASKSGKIDVNMDDGHYYRFDLKDMQIYVEDNGSIKIYGVDRWFTENKIGRAHV